MTARKSEEDIRQWHSIYSPSSSYSNQLALWSLTPQQGFPCLPLLPAFPQCGGSDPASAFPVSSGCQGLPAPATGDALDDQAEYLGHSAMDQITERDGFIWHTLPNKFLSDFIDLRVTAAVFYILKFQNTDKELFSKGQEVFQVLFISNKQKYSLNGYFLLV